MVYNSLTTDLQILSALLITLSIMQKTNDSARYLSIDISFFSIDINLTPFIMQNDSLYESDTRRSPELTLPLTSRSMIMQNHS